MPNSPPFRVRSPHASRWLAYAAAIGVLSLAGCASIPGVPAPPAPPPPVHLLDVGALEIPVGCEPSRGAVYRTHFIVQVDGRVSGAASDPGTSCVEQALREWVSSFRYRPVDVAVPVVIDWMDVRASRGG